MKNPKNENDLRKAAEIFESIADYRDAGTMAEKCLEEIKDYIYQSAMEMYQTAEKSGQNSDWFKAKNRFASLGDYRDSRKYLDICQLGVKNSGIYQTACQKQDSNFPNTLKEAVQLFDSLEGWRDSKERSQACTERILSIEQERKAAVEESNARKNLILVTVIFIVLALIVMAVVSAVSNYNAQAETREQYKAGIVALEEGRYEDAVKNLVGVKDYMYASGRLSEAYYGLGKQEMENGEYESALKHLKNAKNADSLIAEAYYRLGQQEIENGDYSNAIRSLENAQNADDLIAEAYYQLGNLSFQETKYDQAIEQYTSALAYDPDREDAADALKTAYHTYGYQLLKQGKYDESLEYLTEAQQYGAEINWPGFYYGWAQSEAEKGKYSSAIEKFTEAGGYSDAGEQIKHAYYERGASLTEKKSYKTAIEKLEAAGDYPGASEALAQAQALFLEASATPTPAPTPTPTPEPTPQPTPTPTPEPTIAEGSYYCFVPSSELYSTNISVTITKEGNNYKFSISSAHLTNGTWYASRIALAEGTAPVGWRIEFSNLPETAWGGMVSGSIEYIDGLHIKLNASTPTDTYGIYADNLTLKMGKMPFPDQSVYDYDWVLNNAFYTTWTRQSDGHVVTFTTDNVMVTKVKADYSGSTTEYEITFRYLKNIEKELKISIYQESNGSWSGGFPDAVHSDYDLYG